MQESQISKDMSIICIMYALCCICMCGDDISLNGV